MPWPAISLPNVIVEVGWYIKQFCNNNITTGQFLPYIYREIIDMNQCTQLFERFYPYFGAIEAEKKNFGVHSRAHLASHSYLLSFIWTSPREQHESLQETFSPWYIVRKAEYEISQVFCGDESASWISSFLPVCDASILVIWHLQKPYAPCLRSGQDCTSGMRIQEVGPA